MHSPADDPHGMITGAAEIPLVARLDSPTALERAYSGDAVALLARVRALGLPVPDGFVLTTRGVAMLVDQDDGSVLDSLREAWSVVSGRLLITLSECANKGAATRRGARVVDADIWASMLDGIYEVLYYDLQENTALWRRMWALAVMRRPSPGRSALVMTGDPFGHGDGCTILTAEGDAAVSLGPRRCRWLRALAGEARAFLGHPVDLEVVFDSAGAGWVIDCLPYRAPIWS